MFQPMTKLEVNIRRGKLAPTDMHNLSSFLIKNCIPTIIVDPEFIEPMIIERSKFNGGYKIITAVDFNDSGRHFALEKMRDLPQAMFATDGVEVLLTPNRNDKESHNELKAISEFIKQMKSTMEIRWVFGFRVRPKTAIENFMKYLTNFPVNFLRTDPNVDVPKITIKQHQEDLDYIRKYCANPVKISGNIDLKTMSEVKANRFDVSVAQAKKVLKELEAQPVKRVEKEKVVEEV
jgi:hypothetical protein